MRKTNSSTTVSYLQLLKYYQRLQIEVEELREVNEATMKFIQILDDKYGAILMPNSKDIANLKERFSSLEYRKLEEEYSDLRRYLIAGNLRHVVKCLYTEKGMTAKEFGEEIGFTEHDIMSLTSVGIVSFNLLNAICQYFGIMMTEDYTRYINDLEKEN